MARIKTSTTTVSYADTTIAVIGSVEYKTLQAAIDAATEGQQIQLIKSTTMVIFLIVVFSIVILGLDMLLELGDTHLWNFIQNKVG